MLTGESGLKTQDARVSVRAFVCACVLGDDGVCKVQKFDGGGGVCVGEEWAGEIRHRDAIAYVFGRVPLLVFVHSLTREKHGAQPRIRLLVAT